MVDQNKTEIIVVLDRSGSMSPLARDMEGALATFFKDQSKLPGECNATLYEFDTYTSRVFCGQPVGSLPEIRLKPRSATALYDAVHEAISTEGRRFRDMNEAERPGKVIFVVVTDGEENASRKATQELVKARIEEQRSKYNWQFVFLGANQDSWHTGAALGYARGTTLNWEPTSRGVYAAAANLTASASAYRLGEASSVSFSEESET